MENIYYVYKHTFINGSIYIGKGKNQRAFTTYGRNLHYKNTVKLYGKPDIVILHNNLNETLSFQLEMEEIQSCKTANLNLLNKTDGGEGVSGRKNSEATRKKMSDSAKGKKMSAEARLKMSIAQTGTKRQPMKMIECPNCNNSFPINTIKRWHLDNCKGDNRNTQAKDTKKIRANNTTGFKGVSFYSKLGKFHTQITINNKRIHLGYFLILEDAAKAYDNYVIQNKLERTKNNTY